VTAHLVTVQQCNDEDIIVYFDADVIIHAIRDPNSPQLEYMLRILPPLRRYTTTTLYEVAFARKGPARGDALSTLKQNQYWLNDRFPTRDLLDEKVVAGFERSIDQYAMALRGIADLGDAFLASWCRARSSGRQQCAIATMNGRDYRALPVALVKDFLPADFDLGE
jgi:hypothetical protein